MAWAPDYCTASELKSYLGIGDTVDDVELALAITAASRAVDQATGRQFGATATTEARTYAPTWDRRRSLYVIDIDDLMTVTGLGFVDENGTALAALVTLGDGGYRLEPLNAAQEGRPWTRAVTATAATEWTVTATWGWSAVPDTVKKATLLQANRFHKRRGAPFGVAGSPDLGSEMRLLAKVDPDVDLMLSSFRRWWAARS